VVTLPFALGLLDLWPLNRIAGWQTPVPPGAGAGCRPVSAWRLVLEKIPFLALAGAGSVTTYLVQSRGGAVAGMPVLERLANAVLAYARYTAKLFWPTDLAVIYPHPRHWPLWLALFAVGLLLVWTFLCVYQWRKCPYLAVGWFWFLGTLVPTIGLIQVGAQAMADRYTYIPSIGLFVAVIWGVAEYSSLRQPPRWLLPLAAGAVLAVPDAYINDHLPFGKTVLSAVNFGVAFVLDGLLFAAIYKTLPDRDLEWHDVFVGAVATAFLFGFGKFLIGMYLRSSSIASTYGAAGGLIALLLWIYYSAQIFLFGAEFTKAYACRKGSQQNTPELADAGGPSRNTVAIGTD